MGELHPRLATALEAQLERRRKLLNDGAAHVGWKLGLAIAEVDRLGGEPVVGHLTSATLIHPDTSYRPAGRGELRAETELAVEVGDGGAIAGVAVALELVDVARPRGGPEAIVADNVFHRAFALGPLQPPRPTAGLEATLFVGGRLRQSARLEGEPADRLRAAAGMLEAVGERLRRGDCLLTGSVNHVPVGPGDEVTVEIETLGRLEVTIEKPSGAVH